MKTIPIHHSKSFQKKISFNSRLYDVFAIEKEGHGRWSKQAQKESCFLTQEIVPCPKNVTAIAVWLHSEALVGEIAIFYTTGNT